MLDKQKVLRRNIQYPDQRDNSSRHKITEDGINDRRDTYKRKFEIETVEQVRETLTLIENFIDGIDITPPTIPAE